MGGFCLDFEKISVVLAPSESCVWHLEGSETSRTGIPRFARLTTVSESLRDHS
jgi:hypothetical protein